jgi:hypothetical protein
MFEPLSAGVQTTVELAVQLLIFESRKNPTVITQLVSHIAVIPLVAAGGPHL